LTDGHLLVFVQAKLGSIALIGPSADMTQLGDYSGFGVLDNFVTVLDGVSAKAPQAKIYHAWCIPTHTCFYHYRTQRTRAT